MINKTPKFDFEVNSLGPIREGRFTHKPLTIFCGPNNSGKTWAMYSLYRFYRTIEFYREIEDAELVPDLDIINWLVTDGLAEFFNVSPRQLEGAAFRFASQEYWQDLYDSTEDADIFLMPAERNGLHLLFRELSTRRTALLHHVSRENVDLNSLLRDVIYSRYAQPIGDYINWLNNLLEFQNSDQSIYHNHAERLKREIAGGAYRIDRRTGSIEFRPYASRESNARPRNMGLHATSSAVKSLFGLWFYLEHQAAPGNILMIDEPELNIHPANQRLIARLLARLVNARIRVVISTHSDYIIRELNTLIMLSQDRRGSLRRRYRYRDDEVLNPDLVGAYFFDGQSILPFSTTREDGINASLSTM